MTAKSIEEQIIAIKNATAKATASKEAAATFLINAGIIRNSDLINKSASVESLNKK